MFASRPITVFSLTIRIRAGYKIPRTWKYRQRVGGLIQELWPSCIARNLLSVHYLDHIVEWNWRQRQVLMDTVVEWTLKTLRLRHPGSPVAQPWQHDSLPRHSVASKYGRLLPESNAALRCVAGITPMFWNSVEWGSCRRSLFLDKTTLVGTFSVRKDNHWGFIMGYKSLVFREKIRHHKYEVQRNR